MPKIDLYALDVMDEEYPGGREAIRRTNAPVSNRHDTQRRAENGINRFRKQRREKETAWTM